MKNMRIPMLLAGFVLATAACGSSDEGPITATDAGEDAVVDDAIVDSGAVVDTSPGITDAPGETAPTCAAGMPCQCGAATCASNEYCYQPSGTMTKTCRRFIAGVRCIDRPCGPNELCWAVSLNDVVGVRCVPPGKLGDACESDGDIDHNACEGDAWCAAKTCAAKASVDANCAERSKFACSSGQTCQSPTLGTLRCFAARSAGESCLNSTDCALGLYCAGDLLSRRCELRKIEGAACIDGLNGECAPYLDCKAGTCKP